VLLKGIEEEVKLDQKYQPTLTPEQDIVARYWGLFKSKKEDAKVDQKCQPVLILELFNNC
jgi:hypothetical protein